MDRHTMVTVLCACLVLRSLWAVEQTKPDPVTFVELKIAMMGIERILMSPRGGAE
jgi:hypothetical protein